MPREPKKTLSILEYFKQEGVEIKDDNAIGRLLDVSPSLIRRVREKENIPAFSHRSTPKTTEILMYASNKEASEQLKICIAVVIKRRKRLNIKKHRAPTINISHIPDMYWEPIGEPVRGNRGHWIVSCKCKKCGGVFNVDTSNLNRGVSKQCRMCANRK